jgi:hypothetical protein
MAILDHTIVAAHDHHHAASFVAEVLGLSEPVTLGHFAVVRVGDVTNGLGCARAEPAFERERREVGDHGSDDDQRTESDPGRDRQRGRDDDR